MTQRFEADDDYNPHGEHVVEIPTRGHARPPRRSYATLAVAAFIGLSGVVIVGGLAYDQALRAKLDTARRDELRDGWETLGALATEGAEANALAAHAAASAAPTPSTSPIELLPVVQSAPPTVVIVPAQAAPANQSTNAAQPNAAPPAAVPVPVPVSLPAVPNAASALPAFPSGTVSASNPQSAPAASVANGTSAASPVPPIPSGGVPATNPNLPLPTGTVPPAPLPAAQACGIATCDLGSVCCNPSCGICTVPGGTCPLQPCG
jgi:hypothetical protein